VTTFMDWADHHAGLFGFVRPEEQVMLRKWCELFRGEGFTADELRRATDHIAANDPPVWRSEHLQALRDRVRELRNPKPAPPPDEPPPGDCGTCRDCGGTGRVIVPAVGLRTAGGNTVTRPGATAAVVCRCPLGRWFASRCMAWDGSSYRLPMLVLDAYERDRPDWRREADQEREAARLKVQAGGLDAALGQIFARLLGGS
jgi:hypothetical protein